MEDFRACAMTPSERKISQSCGSPRPVMNKGDNLNLIIFPPTKRNNH